jgi:hypothetical protein
MLDILRKFSCNIFLHIYHKSKYILYITVLKQIFMLLIRLSCSNKRLMTRQIKKQNSPSVEGLQVQEQSWALFLLTDDYPSSCCVPKWLTLCAHVGEGSILRCHYKDIKSYKSQNLPYNLRLITKYSHICFSTWILWGHKHLVHNTDLFQQDWYFLNASWL